MARPLADLLRDLPRAFPELAGGGLPERMFRDVLLPQVITRAKKDEAGTRALVVGVIRRCIQLLEIDVAEVSPDPLVRA